MPVVKLPFYKGFIEADIPAKNLKSVLVSKISEYHNPYYEQEVVKEALLNPIKSSTLRKLTKNKKKVLIITSDHTRSVPSKITLPLLLNEVRKGNQEADITILIATGLHRATTREEMVDMFGEKIVNEEKIIVHNSEDSTSFENVGILPSGHNLCVNKLAIEAELLVCEGFIEPHFFAGFSGGRKSILPGICKRETINANHSAKAIAHPNAKTGVLDGNPIHEEMLYAAKLVKVNFILNVALNADKKIIAAFAGDLNDAHLAGCQFVDKLSWVNRVTSDIVITSNGGYPLDQNLYQSPKAMSTAAECAGKDGIIIIAASCCDGIGGKNFERLMLSGSPDSILKKLNNIPETETIPEQWCAQILANIMLKHPIILVTDNKYHQLIKSMNIIPASTMDEAIAIAFRMKGEEASVTVIPDGVSVIVH